MFIILLVTALVANPQFDTEVIKVPLIQGKGHWIFQDGKYADPGWSLTDKEKASGIADLPIFRDCAVSRDAGGKLAPKDPKIATWRTMAENYHGGTNNMKWIVSESGAKLDKPLLFGIWAKRDLKAQVGEIDLDYDDYNTWLKRHSNLFCFRMLSEWENDVYNFKHGHRHWKTSVDREELNRRLLHFPETRDGLLLRLKALYDRQIAIYYGASNLCMALRHTFAADHIAAAYGAKSVCLETTCTSSRGDDEFRWDIQGMFVRGAGRQFNIPWGWYTAIYYHSYTEDGKFIPYSNCWYDPPPNVQTNSPNARPEGGISPSLLNRVWYYAYLNGATWQQTEQWQNYITRIGTNGIPCLTPQGVNYSNFYNFTKANPDRGETYTPVAVLTPFNMGYSTWGGIPWRGEVKEYTQGDCMVDGIFFTVVAGRKRGEELKRGIENCLHNSPYAMMYDVLVPDSPQDPKEFLKRLKAYPVAILAGTYPNVAAFWPTMEEYIKGGGTLLVNRANFNIATNAIVASGHNAIAAGESLRPPVAITDDNGHIIATSCDMGKGRLIVSTSEWMSPPVGPDARKEEKLTLSGARKFPEMEFFLKHFQSELFPFEVSGSCQYGANRTKDGWWLWALNNNGVTKFAQSFERIDPTKASEIIVDLKGRPVQTVRELRSGKIIPVENGAFRYTIPSGEIAIFAIDGD